jgi:CSLREA domain-containing protein
MKRKALRLLVLLTALATAAAGYSSARAGNPAIPVATITVDSLADELLTDSNCTLREAIQAAATNQAVDGCVAGDQLDVIIFSVDGAIEMALGVFVVDAPMTIQGNGRAETVIDAGEASAIFLVNGVSLSLAAMTLQNGFGEQGGAIQVAGDPGNGALELDDIVIQDSIATLEGGAMALPGKRARVFNSLLQRNSAGRGGAIFATDNELLIDNTIIRDNQALSGSGGALNCDNCDLTINLSTMEDNNANAVQGGALYCRDCVAEISRSTLADNVAHLGGGAALFASTEPYPSEAISITRSLITGNYSEQGNGGGIFCECDLRLTDSTVRANAALVGNGGGIYAQHALLEIDGSTINGNFAAQGSGGGIYYQVEGPERLFLLYNSTISGNSALEGGGVSLKTLGETEATIRYATITGNSATAVTNAGGAIFVEPAGNPLIMSRNIVHANSGSPTCYPAGDTVSNGSNVLQDNSCGNHPSDQIGLDPRIGPLGNYGGLTETHALLPTSPAIDAAACFDLVVVDQRGVARPQNESCDSGSYEFEGRSGYDSYVPAILK